MAVQPIAVAQPIHVLLVEDNPADARLLRETLADVSESSFEIQHYPQLSDALGAMSSTLFDVILLDLSLPDVQGLDTVLRTRAAVPGVPIVVLTGLNDEALAVRAVQLGAQDYMVKGEAGGALLSRSIRYAIERHRADRALAERETQLRVLLEQTPAILWSTDRQLTILTAGGGGFKSVGLSATDWMGRKLPDVFHSESQFPAAALRRALTGEASSYEDHWRNRDFHCYIEPMRSSDGVVIGTVGVALDLTERKSLEMQLRQAQKMQAIGRLAGGIAHDFNNLLTIISSYSELLLESPSPTENVIQQVSEIQAAAERAAGLTRQLLAFSRQQAVTLKQIDMNEIVGSMQSILRRLIGEDISLLINATAEAACVIADPSQIEQVILNLVINSRDAMPRGGKLSIETRSIELTDTYIDSHGTVKAGRYVMLAVSDTGVGMTPETQAHIFEPFFSTKPKGKGTGLGLATVYGIVSQGGGYIWVYSEPGQGTTFKIYLPIATGAEMLTELVPEVDEESLQGTETVLLVEDDEPIRRLLRKVLEDRGYTVLEAANGVEALSVSKEFANAIDLLLTDVVMPEMSGRELSEAITTVRPEITVLYMSGYTEDAVVRHNVLTSSTAFLQKPFTPETVARKVREVLSSAARA